jgi:hypothetical protein
MRSPLSLTLSPRFAWGEGIPLPASSLCLPSSLAPAPAGERVGERGLR